PTTRLTKSCRRLPGTPAPEPHREVAPSRARSSGVQVHYVLRPRPLRVLGEVVLDARTPRGRREPCALECRMVHEPVLSSGVRLDESEPLVVHEPLHGAGLPYHCPSLSAGVNFTCR